MHLKIELLRISVTDRIYGVIPKANGTAPKKINMIGD
jgi:hypothetical protein